MHLRRSILLAAGDDEAQLRALIATSNADMVCLDLEDTVVPERKRSARAVIARLLRSDIWGRTARAYRINAMSTPFAEDDLAEVIGGAKGRVDAVFMSKADSEHEVRRADEIISRVTAGRRDGDAIRLVVGIESAQALTRIDQIAASCRRVGMLGFAIGDLSNSLGVRVGPYLRDRRLYGGDLFHFVRSRINLAAKAHGLLSLDGPWPILNDHATLTEDARWGAMLGFDGKMALSVDQVRVIHEAYRPADEEVARARRVLDLYSKAVAQGASHGFIEGEFIDPVSVGQAQATLQRAAAPL
jgi:citrate lyase subunit beta / citryl-CoA lyase